MLGGHTQTLEERVQALEARLANVDALTAELATLKARIISLEAPPNTAPTVAASHQPSGREDPQSPEIDWSDHRPYMGEPEQGRFFYADKEKGVMFCKLCKREDHEGAHFNSPNHEKKATYWLNWGKQFHPEEFPSQAYGDGNHSVTPYPAPVPAPPLCLLDGQANLNSPAPTSSAPASDAWAGYCNRSGASDDTKGQSTPWASSSSWNGESGWENPSWPAKHWGN